MTTKADVESYAKSILLWEQELDTIDYFELLGASDDDTDTMIESAYHRFALRFHPDCHPHAEARTRQALTNIFQRGVEARRVLCDPALRVRYRAALRRGQLRLLDEDARGGADLERDLPKLHELCRSAGAKLETMAAMRAWRKGNHAEVRRHLESALRFEGDANLEIRNCIEALGLDSRRSQVQG